MNDHTKKVRLVSPKRKFVFHAEGIITSREQEGNWDWIYPGFPHIMIPI